MSEKSAQNPYDARPWTKHYDKHVPASMLPYPEHALQDFLTRTAQKQPHETALITTAKLPLVGRLSAEVTYRELDNASNALAAALVDMGLKKGETVAIILPNCTAFAIAYYGILKAGGIVAATNPTYPPAKMEYQINDCDARFIICLSLFYNMVKAFQHKTKVEKVIVANIKDYLPPLAKLLFTLTKEKKDGHAVTIQPGDMKFLDVLSQYAGKNADVKVTADDIAVFQYTGGTTGVSKGAMSTHRALVTNTYQIQKWTGMSEGIFPVKMNEMTFLGAIPMFHAYGLVALLTQSVSAGGTIILVPNPRDVDEVVDVIHHYKPNVFLGVPALYNAVNNHKLVQDGKISLKSFVFNSSGSAPLPPETKRSFEAKSGSQIAEGFGMSEILVACHSNPVVGENKLNSVGMPFPDVDVRIVSLDDGITPMKVGEPGELIVHCINMMTVYYKSPTETANTLRKLDGKTWLYTGDIAYMDEQGYFYLIDRKKDMALIGGFNVYPANIEKVIKDHPSVLEVGVAAIPHPEKVGQEALKAWIVLKPDMLATEEEIIKHCEKFLAMYEIPRRISFIPELPKTAVGKTLRRELIRLEMEAVEK